MYKVKNKILTITLTLGLFSFFAVPILLGDITIDFMNMIDIMVDVMITGEEGDGMGGNNNNNNNNNDGMGMSECMGSGNNNCNNNNNGRRRRRRKRRSGINQLNRQEFLHSVLQSCK